MQSLSFPLQPSSQPSPSNLTTVKTLLTSFELFSVHIHVGFEGSVLIEEVRARAQRGIF